MTTSPIDVLFTHSYHLAFDRKQVRKMQPYPPLGTLYAAGYLRAQGLRVAVYDTMLNSTEGFTSALAMYRPRIVAIYDDDFNFLTKMCLTNMRRIAWEFAKQAQESGAVVIGHGSDSTDRSAAYLCNGFDAILSGEAEPALHEVCTRLLEGTNWQDAAGVTYVKAAEFICNAPRKPMNDIDCLPGPAWDLVDLDAYRSAWESAHGYFSLNMVSSRGCPFQCNWCAKPIFGNHFSLRSAALVAAEMKRLRDEHGAEHIWFADDIFGLNRHWVAEFANEVERLDCRTPFKMQTRAELLNAETVDDLKRAGCDEVWMGVESGAQSVLNAMDKGLSPSNVADARENLRKAGIKACYFLQFGYPGERWEELQETIDLVRKTRPNDIGVSFSYPLPNTRFHNLVREQMGRKQNWADSEDLCVMFKGAYTDAFYRAVRDALHAEVDSWHGATSSDQVEHLWRSVAILEPESRNAHVTELPMMKEIVPLQNLQSCGREA